jgi:hypothetical protein
MSREEQVARRGSRRVQVAVLNHTHTHRKQRARLVIGTYTYGTVGDVHFGGTLVWPSTPYAPCVPRTARPNPSRRSPGVCTVDLLSVVTSVLATAYSLSLAREREGEPGLRQDRHLLGIVLLVQG